MNDPTRTIKVTLGRISPLVFRMAEHIHFPMSKF